MARRETSEQSSMIAYTYRARGVIRHLAIPAPAQRSEDYFYKSSYPPKTTASNSQSSPMGGRSKKSSRLPPLLDKKTRSLDQFELVDTDSEEDFKNYSDSELTDRGQETGRVSVSIGLTADEMYDRRLGKLSDGAEDAHSPAFDIQPFPDFHVEEGVPYYYSNSRIRAAIRSRKEGENKPAKPRRAKNKPSEIKGQPAKKTPWKRKYRSKSKGGRDYDSKHPVRKHFIYSDVVDKELKSQIPPRLPGGLLKPIYRRDQESGDLRLPTSPIEISVEELVLSQPPTPSEEQSGIRNEALKRYLEKTAKKRDKKKIQKKRKKVRFLLPDENLGSAASRTRESIKSPPPSYCESPDGDLSNPTQLSQTLLSEVVQKLEGLECTDGLLNSSNAEEAPSEATNPNSDSNLTLPSIFPEIPKVQELLQESGKASLAEKPSLKIPSILISDTYY